MKKNLEQVSVIKVGDTLYTPLSTYTPDNNAAVIFTSVEEIYEENGEVFIMDSDGDILKPEWLGVSFFLSQETMKFWYEQTEKKFGKHAMERGMAEADGGEYFSTRKV